MKFSCTLFTADTTYAQILFLLKASGSAVLMQIASLFRLVQNLLSERELSQDHHTNASKLLSVCRMKFVCG